MICPPCDLHPLETIEENQLRVLNAEGPADGTCEGANVKVINRGSDYGLNYDACCCMPVPEYPPIQCDPLGPGISMCPVGPPFFKSELLGEYAVRVGELVKDSAPTDGCCANGTTKFIFPPSMSGQSNELCVCFDPNSHAADMPLTSSSSTMSVPELSSSTLDNTSPTYVSSSPVVCPSCNLQLNETIQDNELKILTAKGLSDGTCEGADVKVIYRDSFLNGACCCIPVPEYPPIQCDPVGPGISTCPYSLPFIQNELFSQYIERVGVLMKDSAPEDGCCPNGYSKFIFPPSLTGQSNQLCVCFDPENPFETITDYYY